MNTTNFHRYSALNLGTVATDVLSKSLLVFCKATKATPPKKISLCTATFSLSFPLRSHAENTHLLHKEKNGCTADSSLTGLDLLFVSSKATES